MKDDPIVVLLSLIVVITAVGSLSVGFIWSLPYALRRVRRYDVPGSARRLFAQYTLSNTAIPILSMMAFFAVGAITLTMDNTDFRLIIIRTLVMFAIVATGVQIVLAPIGHKYVEGAAERERRDRQDTAIQEIASETLAGIREVQEALREVQVAAEMVRTKLKEYDVAKVVSDESRDTKQVEDLRISRNISEETLAAVREVQEAAELVRTRLEEQNEARGALDESRDTKQGQDLDLSQNISDEQGRLRDKEEE